MLIKPSAVLLLPLVFSSYHCLVYSQQITANIPNNSTNKSSVNKGAPPLPATQGADKPISVSINRSDAQTMANQLKGIGLKKAQAIVEYREKFGPFTAVEQLAEVPGFGPTLVEQNKHQLKL